MIRKHIFIVSLWDLAQEGYFHNLDFCKSTYAIRAGLRLVDWSDKSLRSRYVEAFWDRLEEVVPDVKLRDLQIWFSGAQSPESATVLIATDTDKQSDRFLYATECRKCGSPMWSHGPSLCRECRLRLRSRIKKECA